MLNLDLLDPLTVDNRLVCLIRIRGVWPIAEHTYTSSPLFKPSMFARSPHIYKVNGVTSGARVRLTTKCKTNIIYYKLKSKNLISNHVFACMFVKLVFNVLKSIEILSSAQVIKTGRYVRLLRPRRGLSEISSSQVQLTKAKRSHFNPSLQIYI